ncbi:D-alanyl-D-alanine carboxypeptidase/D-alanyl-D-alanine endopeptidase [Candidatus Protochlamydia phocaeensis]|uniref:D-alanyl-D-alanine carboxypeptidase/D-alanyl-D-alanine endopeptidase n=1 Tax=Candidatus Protochlamydia phocaeensis TaxID=1414722 RepID=UPI000837E937|nr:D-alanyl-D-alanine carboxypeptidase/D-alanyl-D-alanine-endopeptidase [Candidatus Protochlamydia phocaeensis]
MLGRPLLFSLFLSFMPGLFLKASPTPTSLPEPILSLMHQPKYQHAFWGVYVKDLETEEIVFNLNDDRFFLPASTTKMFSVAALLHTFGDDYRFKTPVFAIGSLKEGRLTGDLILVAQGDLAFGGRSKGPDELSFTKLDHTLANNLPGVLLTPEDPLYGLNDLAKQIKQQGIHEINGNILIDDRLFEITEKREMTLSPLFINENVIDLILNPTAEGQKAQIDWRPKVEGYTIINEVRTVGDKEALDLQMDSDESGKQITIKGSLPIGEKDIIRTFAIKDINQFAQTAFIQALRSQGIAVNLDRHHAPSLPPSDILQKLAPIAVWTSPPLFEYAKLILKVSHNLGADLIPLLLAAKKGKKTFDDGMEELGQFLIQDVKISPDSFVFIDAAGGDGNRLTPLAEVQLLEYMSKKPQAQFEHFFNALPILGVDGSLADVAKNTAGAGKVWAKTGSGLSFNLATRTYFLTTKTFAGYIKSKNGHLLAFMVSVNNGTMPALKDVFAIMEDVGQITSLIYEAAP